MRSREERRHEIRKFRKPVTMEATVEHTKKRITAAVIEMEDRGKESMRRKVYLYPVYEDCKFNLIYGITSCINQ